MSEIKAADVAKLRKMTGAGMMDCKMALQEADGDFNKATEIIRKKGQAVASKRADREASEGVVLAKTSPDGKHGFMIVRLVDVIPSIGDEFAEARPMVERVYFDEIRSQLVEALHESPRYHIFVNRHGMPLREVLERMGSPSAAP